MNKLQEKFDYYFNKLAGLYIKYHDKLDGLFNDCFYSECQLRCQTDNLRELEAINYHDGRCYISFSGWKNNKGFNYSMEIDLNNDSVKYLKYGKISISEKTFNKRFNELYKYTETHYQEAIKGVE